MTQRERLGGRWFGGFEIYDRVKDFYNKKPQSSTEGEALTRNLFKVENAKEDTPDNNYAKLDTWERFCERCPELLAALKGASLE